MFAKHFESFQMFETFQIFFTCLQGVKCALGTLVHLWGASMDLVGAFIGSSAWQTEAYGASVNFKH